MLIRVTLLPACASPELICSYIDIESLHSSVRLRSLSGDCIFLSQAKIPQPHPLAYNFCSIVHTTSYYSHITSNVEKKNEKRGIPGTLLSVAGYTHPKIWSLILCAWHKCEQGVNILQVKVEFTSRMALHGHISCHSKLAVFHMTPLSMVTGGAHY